MSGRYWSVSECGWVASPGSPDPLATPWAAHGFQPPVLPHPLDADDVLRTRPASGVLPGQRELERPAVHPR
jgi:hypothetical protein